jgi:hypothetical protein
MDEPGDISLREIRQAPTNRYYLPHVLTQTWKLKVDLIEVERNGDYQGWEGRSEDRG